MLTDIDNKKDAQPQGYVVWITNFEGTNQMDSLRLNVKSFNKVRSNKQHREYQDNINIDWTTRKHPKKIN